MKRLLSIFILLAGLMMVSCKDKYVASVTELQLASVSPGAGYSGGIITIYGRNFSEEFGQNKVYIGELEAKVLEYNAWDLTVLLPAQPLGTYPIKVVTPKGEVAGLSFDYIEKPEHDYIVSTIAGSGKNAHADGNGSGAQFSFPEGIDIDADGNLWVTQRGSTLAVRKIDPHFNVTTVATVPLPWHGGFDANWNYHIATKDANKIVKVASDGTLTELSVTGGTLNNLMDVEFDAQGNMWICSRNPVPGVLKVAGTAVTKTYTYKDTENNVEMTMPTCVAFDAKGRALVGTNGPGYLFMIDGDTVTPIAGTGAMSTSGSLNGTAGDTSTATIGWVGGIDVAEDGSVYFGDITNLSVRKLTPDESGDYAKGKIITIADGLYPSDLCVDSSGTRIYVTCATAHCVKMIEIF